MKKKPIDIFEEHLDKLATTTVEKDLERETEKIWDILLEKSRSNKTAVAYFILKVLVSKGIVSLKDFERVLEK